MSNILVWNSIGNSENVPPFPESFDHWEVGQPLDELRWAIIQEVEAALSINIARMDVRAMDRAFVLDVEYEDGRHDIVRATNPGDERNKLGPELNRRLRRELDLLRWLKTTTTIPIPAIRRVIQPCDPNVFPVIIIMEKLPGSMGLNALGLSPYSAKEQLMRDMADVQVQLFRLALPPRIGTAEWHDGKMEVIPMSGLHTAPKVFNTLEEYVSFLLDTWQHFLEQEADTTTRELGSALLTRAKAELPALYTTLAHSPQAYRRCMLMHDDPTPMNFLMDATSGRLTGVIDWEYQSVLPAVLAVGYPFCIRYDGARGPGYPAPTSSQELQQHWCVSPEDAETLREVYSESIRAKDQECWEALVEGERLRQLIEWLRENGPYPAMERWMNAMFPRQQIFPSTRS
ncbi:hypothetical protein C8Q79DRAFT_921510 [Trametes meyenii]|nr:hypothetical protein C8Q79DRAFT_921510 [Trametes meyenii]